MLPGTLPGAIVLVVLLAAAATYPLSRLILAVYGRAVRRSMRTRTHEGARAARAPGDSEPPPSSSAVGLPALSGDAAVLARDMRRRPWMAARAYALAAAVYGIAMTAVMLTVTGNWGGPFRFATLALVYGWPAILTLGIVAAPARRTRVVIGTAYFVVLFALGAIGVAGSREGSTFGALLLWALLDAPPTVLLLAFMSRRIRAVGPLVFVFLLMTIVGAHLLLTAIGASDDLLRTVTSPLFDAGLGAGTVFVGIAAVGAVLFGILGWIALTTLRRLYEAKTLSDESVTLGAMWAIFALSHTIGLLFEGPYAFLAAPIPFAAFVLTARAALPRVRVDGTAPPRLLLLRSFSIGAEGERLFDAIEKHWRRVGSIQMIAGFDLASRTVEPHEFLDFVSGRLARRFIDGREAFDVRLREMDTAPDYDGRFRINDFFCYDDTWRMVLTTLVRQSHAVLMDLRGFTRDNTGCIFEIHELFRAASLGRVVFVINQATDERLLHDTLRTAAQAAGTTTEAQVLRLDALTPAALGRLLDLLAHAAYGAEARAA